MLKNFWEFNIYARQSWLYIKYFTTQALGSVHRADQAKQQGIALCCTVPYSLAQWCKVQFCTVIYTAKQCITVHYIYVLCRTLWYSAVQINALHKSGGPNITLHLGRNPSQVNKALCWTEMKINIIITKNQVCTRWTSLSHFDINTRMFGVVVLWSQCKVYNLSLAHFRVCIREESTHLR